MVPHTPRTFAWKPWTPPWRANHTTTAAPATGASTSGGTLTSTEGRPSPGTRRAMRTSIDDRPPPGSSTPSASPTAASSTARARSGATAWGIGASGPCAERP